MPRHKHYDSIVAWADGIKIQRRILAERSQGGVFPWEWVDDENPNWDSGSEYRVKPITIKYKRYLYMDNLGFRVMVANDCGLKPDPREDLQQFVRWIDTEWQEVEV